MYKFTFALAIGLFLCLSSTQVHAWGWKKATDPNDVMNFLNSKAPYKQKIKAAEITAVNKGAYIEFIVFYRPDNTPNMAGGWGYKKATDPDDVKDFLSGQGAYKRPVKEAKVVAVEKQTYTEYYVFYKRRLEKHAIPPQLIIK